MSIPRHTRPERNATATAGHPAVASTRSASQFAKHISALEHMFTPPPFFVNLFAIARGRFGARALLGPEQARLP